MEGIWHVKKDAIHVKFSLDGMEFFALVVIVDYAYHRVMDFTKENFLAYSLQKKRHCEMSCKGICTRFKAKWGAHQFRYSDGQKRCNVCELFVKWDGHWCPCCGMSLRTRPRSRKYKGKFFVKNQY